MYTIPIAPFTISPWWSLWVWRFRLTQHTWCFMLCLLYWLVVWNPDNMEINLINHIEDGFWSSIDGWTMVFQFGHLWWHMCLDQGAACSDVWDILDKRIDQHRELPCAWEVRSNCRVSLDWEHLDRKRSGRQPWVGGGNRSRDECDESLQFLTLSDYMVAASPNAWSALWRNVHSHDHSVPQVAHLCGLFLFFDSVGNDGNVIIPLGELIFF